MPTVVLLGTLDTKGREYGYVKECLIEAGVTPLMVDFGVLGEPPFEPDISASEVAEAGGATLSGLRLARLEKDARAAALDTMTSGLIQVLSDLRNGGRCDAVFGLGGSGGSSVISDAMRSLPLGVPKLLLSTMASGNVGGYIGSRDIAIMYSVTDIAGLNRISRSVIRNASFGIAGMAQAGEPRKELGRPLIAVTMFGITTPGGLHIVEQLEEAGFETVVFHANGSGRAMEELIDEGLIDGVIEYSLSELTDFVVGGDFHAGPDRLEAAGREGIPQVVVPAGIEVCNFWRDTVQQGYDTSDRKLIVHNALVCAIRINKEESVKLGRLVARKLNLSKGPTAVLVPLNGLDMYEEPPDGPWIDKDKDRALFDAIRLNLRDDILYRELNGYVNDRDFAHAAVDLFLSLWKTYQDRCESR